MFPLLLLTFALLAFAGYFGYRYYQTTQLAVPSPPPTPTPIVIPVQMGKDLVEPPTPAPSIPSNGN